MARDPHPLLPLKPLEFSILVALVDEEHYGYALAGRLARQDMGAIRLAPGNLYHVLDRMIAAGLVEERVRADLEDERRRWYGITSWGRAVAAAEAARLRALLATAERLALAPEGGPGKGKGR
jgi:DNA-binding PadR family transcriptional regulator